MPALRTEKPPVPAVPNAVHTASNTGMPPNSSSTISTTVMTEYTPYSSFAVERMRGTSLPATGPGTSARMSTMERLSDIGTTAITNTSTPMPPTQCEKLRQNSTPCGSVSTCGRIDAPVVVKPEIISNSASTYEGIAPLMTIGSAPNAEMRIHAAATVTSPSRAKIALFFGRRQDSETPTTASSSIVKRNAFRSPSP